MGDFNFPNVKWEPGKIPANLNSVENDNVQLNFLLEFLRNNLMSQVIMDPTRGYNTLDLIIVNDVKLIQN